MIKSMTKVKVHYSHYSNRNNYFNQISIQNLFTYGKALNSGGVFRGNWPPKNQWVHVGWYCYSSLNISAWAFAACTYYVETTVGCVLELLYTL